jgi:hypothetical protein
VNLNAGADAGPKEGALVRYILLQSNELNREGSCFFFPFAARPDKQMKC